MPIDPDVKMEINQMEQRMLHKIDILRSEVNNVGNRFDDYKGFAGLSIATVTLITTIIFSIAGYITVDVGENKAKAAANNEINSVSNRLTERVNLSFRDRADEIGTNDPGTISPIQEKIIHIRSQEGGENPSTQDLYFQGYKNYLDGEYNNAIEKFKKVIESGAKKSVKSLAYHQMASAFYKLENYQEAINNLHKEIKLNPYHPKIFNSYYSLAYNYSMNEDKENAIKFLEKAIINGYTNLDHIGTDSDLDFVRNDKDSKEKYLQLIKTIKN